MRQLIASRFQPLIATIARVENETDGLHVKKLLRFEATREYLGKDQIFMGTIFVSTTGLDKPAML